MVLNCLNAEELGPPTLPVEEPCWPLSEDRPALDPPPTTWLTAGAFGATVETLLFLFDAKILPNWCARFNVINCRLHDTLVIWQLSEIVCSEWLCIDWSLKCSLNLSSKSSFKWCKIPSIAAITSRFLYLSFTAAHKASMSDSVSNCPLAMNCKIAWHCLTNSTWVLAPNSTDTICWLRNQRLKVNLLATRRCWEWGDRVPPTACPLGCFRSQIPTCWLMNARPDSRMVSVDDFMYFRAKSEHQ